MPSWNTGDYHQLSFAVHKSRRYHANLRGFYNTCNELAVAAAAVTGSSAWVALWGTPNINDVVLAKYLAAIVSIASVLNLVFRFRNKAESHTTALVQFTELAAKLEEWPATEEYLHRARAERIRIEKEEPTVRRLVDLQAYNEEARARGMSSDYLVPLSPAQKSYLAYILPPFGMNRLEQWVKDHQKMMNDKLSPTH